MTTDNYRANRPLTARLVAGGGIYWSNRRRRTARVAAGSTAVVCHACEFELHRPDRLGDAERLRREHLRSAHWRELVAGTVVLGEAPDDWEQRMLEVLR
jgi:hypothetical protein